MRWFGAAPWGPVCEDVPQGPQPVGQPCGRCGDVFDGEDIGVLVPRLGRVVAPGVAGEVLAEVSEDGFHQRCFLALVAPVYIDSPGWEAVDGGPPAWLAMRPEAAAEPGPEPGSGG